ncbi:MAG: SufB/SufD family protein [Promethearchaeota archaeon]
MTNSNQKATASGSDDNRESNPDEFIVVDESEHKPVDDLKDLSPDLKEKLKSIGLLIAEESKAASFLQEDQSVSYCNKTSQKVEVIPLKDALEKYSWVKKDYYWKLLSPELDEYTKDVAKGEISQGYFIRALAGQKETSPIQTCLYIGKDKAKQLVHNVVIAEEDSEINILTGCMAHHDISKALHEGMTEIYVKKNAKVTFTMIHEWKETIEVQPRTAIILEDGANFISNYVILRPVRKVKSNPIAILKGENSSVLFQTIIYGRKDSLIDVGSRAMLNARNTSAELITRAIGNDNSTIIVRGLIAGNAPGAKGHLECRGLLLSEQASIDSIPELDARNPDLDITHEAAVGKIAQEEIQYLQSRGASEDEATSMIINGFLSFDFSQLPEEISKETKKMINLTMEGS